ncbi:EAL domain-containing protein [Rheinheimera sp. UJ51]|uniref:bifunctional diguanylate cyclase/phosphodiesterase n=1 Tax=Rheinheimera sp. UJ51 TaxID=2892446 RepID=UPI001E371E30|nr:EAL domain-containing protein [Rheinheimera sp. UJ51]MCC5452970.1 EAL domain-containing protein [Rheinheimera sp. UJ51]
MKFSILVFLAMLIAGLTVMFTYGLYQQQTDEAVQLKKQALLQRNSDFYHQQLDKYLEKQEIKARRAHQLISEQLNERPVTRSNTALLTTLADGSRRQQHDFSGLYIAPDARVNVQNSLLQRSTAVWHDTVPLLQHDFFAVFFIAKDNYVQVTPAGWAADFSVDISLLNNPLFQLAAPEQNPERSLRWSPVYFDSIWQQWMLSMLLPVYQQEQFLGVMGFTLPLSELTQHRIASAEYKPNTHALLLDRMGQAISDSVSSSMRNLPMFSPYQGAKVSDPLLSELLQTPNQTLSHSRFMMALSAFNRLDWQFALYQEKQTLLQQQDFFVPRMLFLTLLVAIAVTLLLHFFINQMLLKRLKKLASAVNRVGRGAHPGLQLDTKHDELGILNRAFTAMFEEINQLVTGLDTRIAEKEQAELLARKLSKAVAFSSSGIVITNKHLDIEYVNPFLTTLLKVQSASILGKPLSSLFAEDMQKLTNDMMQSLAERQHWRGDVLLLQEDATDETEQAWVTLALAPIRDERGELSHYVAAMQDISFIKRSQKQMEQLAYFDSLTGLANRSYFRNQLRKAISMSQRGYYTFALLYFDLDEFKLINDTLGHDAGDELLIEVAKRLTSRLREDDTIARLGGDEFAVILSDIKDKMHAGQIAGNLQQAFTQPVQLGTHTVAISASIGITVAPDDGAEEEVLIKHADLAMYEAKARGKNTYRFFSRELNEAATDRLLIENQLREAIREQQFLMYYQPKIDIQDDTVVGYEALIRWLRPDNTLVPPARFIPVAESTGLIVKIGEWIILESCRFLARQHSRGYAVSLSINLSARQFNDNRLPTMIEQIIQRTGVDPSYLVFEITESMLMGDTDAAIKQLNQLKRLGVSLSIDDFGTGYSSLNYLKRFPVDELKIDRSFVKDIPEDRNDMDIVSAIIAMAQKMQLRVVAEGVESEAQVDFLKQNACYIVQGYYYSMPLAEQELSHLTFTIKT